MTLKLFFQRTLHFLCLSCLLFSSCNKAEPLANDESRVITANPIYSSNDFGTRSDTDTEIVGYHCSSSSSNIICDIFPDYSNTTANSVLYDSDGYPLTTVSFSLGEIEEDGSCHFITYNRQNEPLLSGIFNEQLGYIIFDSTYNVATRSSFGWVCNMSLGTAGLIWSTAAGMVSAGAGFVVGLAYTAFTYWCCDTAEKKIQNEKQI